MSTPVMNPAAIAMMSTASGYCVDAGDGLWEDTGNGMPCGINANLATPAQLNSVALNTNVATTTVPVSTTTNTLSTVVTSVLPTSVSTAITNLGLDPTTLTLLIAAVIAFMIFGGNKRGR